MGPAMIRILLIVLVMLPATARYLCEAVITTNGLIVLTALWLSCIGWKRCGRVLVRIGKGGGKHSQKGGRGIFKLLKWFMYDKPYSRIHRRDYVVWWILRWTRNFLSSTLGS